MDTNFFIGDNIGSINSDDKSEGVIIFTIKTENISIKFEKYDGPFNSINQLKKESSIFKKLVKTSPSRVQKILKKKNIINMKDFILLKEKKSYSIDIIKTFEHTTKGDVKSKRIYGIHYFDNEKMKIKKITENTDSQGVWKALVEVYDMKQNKWFDKESTFFPRDWSLTQLFHECEYAIQNKVKCYDKQSIYLGKTLCGIPVEIIIKNNELKSIYPIMSRITTV
jgi:Bacterial EndoU nuclease